MGPSLNVMLLRDMAPMRLPTNSSTDLALARTGLPGTGQGSGPLANASAAPVLRFSILAHLEGLPDRGSDDDLLLLELKLLHQLIGVPVSALVEDASPVTPGVLVQFL